MGYQDKKKESLCWSCRFAYALPDEEGGCGWHRQEHERMWEECRVKESYQRFRDGRVNVFKNITVTKCSRYELSARGQKEKKHQRKQLQENAEKARNAKMGAPLKFGTETLEQMLMMHKAGLSQEQIASEVGCSRGYVGKLLLKAEEEMEGVLWQP